MHLWNDYENTTLAGQWTLGRLLRTEGRSALFTTTRPDGKPAVLRLTEALNDQAVLQARYRAIQAAGDKYLVRVEGFGDAELDGTPLSYAVLEPTQESLADILAQRRLAPEEAQEVATVVAGGLAALHAQGLVHGLLEPESVLAAGDQIKLRSDCARPAPSAEDALLEGAVTPKTDAWGLADIIYRSLTQNRLHDASDALALPEPFATVVRNAARGVWGVGEMEAELRRGARPAVPVAPAPVKAQTPALAPVKAPVTAPAMGTPVAARVESVPATADPVRTGDVERAVLPDQPLSSRAARVESSSDKDEAWRQPAPISPARRRGVLVGAAVAVILLGLFLLFHHGGKPAPRAATVAPAPVASQARPPAPETTAAQPSQGPGATQAAGGSGEVWRVVAYTYSRKGGADHRAAAINKKHPQFKAEEWSRTGGAPFLVVLGGAMPHDQAMEMRDLARKMGLARDAYVQNYSR